MEDMCTGNARRSSCRTTINKEHYVYNMQQFLTRILMHKDKVLPTLNKTSNLKVCSGKRRRLLMVFEALLFSSNGY